MHVPHPLVLKGAVLPLVRVHIHSPSSVRRVDNPALVGRLDELALDLVDFLV